MLTMITLMSHFHNEAEQRIKDIGSAFISAAQTRPWQLLWPACPGCKHAFCNAAQVADTIVTKEIS